MKFSIYVNSVVWFHDFFGDKYRVERSDFKPVVSARWGGRRLNYINGTPYPPKTGGARRR